MKKAKKQAAAKTSRRSEGERALQDFDLLQHLPHLLRRAHFEAEAIFPDIYGDEVTSRQLALLTAIGQRPGLSQSAVAQQVGMDLNTCSDLVARLVARKLVRRERSEADARTYCLNLAPKGARVVDMGIGLAGNYRQSVAQRLSQAEHERLVALLQRLLGLERTAP
ncbi:MarR family transcriptional regulator [Roseiarcaceae bacterium H3SJ34-1]|uniref:MarR family winged helix-turn-helix transcriptional regulator n=1 Tax=Terripilifer ovatus TaxID=3032367 RepID=UPI003AB96F94|nr:MarR family transcriptional regulator [Roseiarcaceae bacterium H3SJ34-1]